MVYNPPKGVNDKLNRNKKRMMPRIAQITIIFIFLASAFGLSSCTTAGPSPPVNLQMSFPHGAPKLEQTAELLCAIKTPALTADNVTVKINLPDGLQLVSGDLLVQCGTMFEGDVREIKANIKPIKVGNYAIEAELSLVPRRLNFNPGPGLYTIYLSVTENSAQWGKYPPWTPPPPSDPVGDRPTPPSISPYE